MAKFVVSYDGSFGPIVGLDRVPVLLGVQKMFFPLDFPLNCVNR